MQRRWQSSTEGLSRLQRDMLRAIYTQAVGYMHTISYSEPAPFVRWQPGQWFGKSDAERAATSRALRHLEDRGLVERKRNMHAGRSYRTELCRLTGAGLVLAKRLNLDGC